MDTLEQILFIYFQSVCDPLQSTQSSGSGTVLLSTTYFIREWGSNYDMVL